MNVVGLIVEYNPLHNGHAYHFEQATITSNADATVAIMSGNFLQRGEPAIVNKWARAEMALRMGADLVLELPYVYATQSAQLFAFGACSILERLGFVTHLCFGSEHGQLNDLQYLAQKLSKESSEFQHFIQQFLKKGLSYPQAYARAIKQAIYDAPAQTNLISKPNNILGLYYLMALNQLQSKIEPLTIQRIKADYHESRMIDQTIASATAIRERITRHDGNIESIRAYVPHQTYQILQHEIQTGRAPMNWEQFSSLVIQNIMRDKPECLARIYEVNEGFEYRLHAKAMQADSIKHLCQLLKTKRYTWNRIQRILTHTFIRFTKHEAQQLTLENGAPYARILGFTEKGQQLLRMHKKNRAITLISKVDRSTPNMFDWDLQASFLYSFGYPDQRTAFNERKRDVRQAPIQV